MSTPGPSNPLHSLPQEDSAPPASPENSGHEAPYTPTQLSLTHPRGRAGSGLRVSEPASLVPQCRVGQKAFQDRHTGLPLPRPGHAPNTSLLTTLGLLGEPGTRAGPGCSPSQDLSDGSALAPACPGPAPRLREQLQFWQPRPEAN